MEQIKQYTKPIIEIILIVLLISIGLEIFVKLSIETINESPNNIRLVRFFLGVILSSVLFLFSFNLIDRFIKELLELT